MQEREIAMVLYSLSHFSGVIAATLQQMINLAGRLQGLVLGFTAYTEDRNVLDSPGELNDRLALKTHMRNVIYRQYSPDALRARLKSMDTPPPPYPILNQYIFSREWKRQIAVVKGTYRACNPVLPELSSCKLDQPWSTIHWRLYEILILRRDNEIQFYRDSEAELD